jgi:CysZ protein
MSLRLSYGDQTIAFDATAHVEVGPALIVFSVTRPRERARGCRHHDAAPARELVQRRTEDRIDPAISIGRDHARRHQQRKLPDDVCSRELESDQLAFDPAHARGGYTLLTLRKSRFAEGLAAPWQGLGFVVGNPSVWGLSLVPIVVFLAILALASTLGIMGVEHFVAPWLEGSRASTSWHVVVVLLRILLWIVSVLVGVLFAIALAQPISGFALEALARRQSRALGAPDLPELPGSFFRSLRVNLFGLLVTLPIVLSLTVVSLLVPPLAVITVPLKFLVSALMLAWDLMDYPLSVRGAGVRVRLRWFSENFGAAMGFGISIAIVFLVPGAGLLFLPAGVAGATRLVVTSERLLPAGNVPPNRP